MYNEAVCQVTTLMTLLNGCLLKSVTENSALPPVHYERIFMYCMAWGLGGLLDVKDRPALDAELRNMSDALPKKVSLSHQTTMTPRHLQYEFCHEQKLQGLH